MRTRLLLLSAAGLAMVLSMHSLQASGGEYGPPCCNYSNPDCASTGYPQCNIYDDDDCNLDEPGRQGFCEKEIEAE